MGSLDYYNSFSDNLALRNYSSNIDVYFDSFDTLTCVKGIYDFYDSSKGFSEEHFLKNEIIVHALACIGLIGKVYLLSPHKSEVIQYLYYFEPDYNLKSFKNNLTPFLRNLLKDTSFSNDREVRLEQIKDSRNVLKLITLMQPEHWKTRLEYLINTSSNLVIKKDLEDEVNLEDYEKIIVEYYKYLESRRPDRTQNNKIDSIALGMLAQKVKETNDFYRGSEGNTSLSSPQIPIYYDSSKSIRNFLDENPDLKDSFVFRSGSRNVSIIQGYEFFLCLSLYYADENDVADWTNLIQSILPKHTQRLKKIEEHFNIITVKSSNQVIQHETDSELYKIENELRDYTNYDFIVNVVIPCFTQPENRKFIDELSRKYSISDKYFLFEETTKSVQQILEKDLSYYYQDVLSTLLQYEKSYGFLLQMSIRLPKLYRVLKQFERGSEIELFHAAGLTRFFIDEDIVSQLKAKFLSYEKIQYLTDESFIVELNNNFKKIKDKKKLPLYNLYELLIIIWLTSEYNFANEIYDETVDFNPSLLMLFGSNFVRDDKSTLKNTNSDQVRYTRTNNIIRRLLNKSSENNLDVHQKVHCFLAASFLRFQLIMISEQDGYDKRMTTNKKEEIKECLSSIKEAIHYLEMDSSDDLHLTLYLTNIDIYYNILLDTDNIFDLEDKINSFLSYEKSHPSFWHYRYDDTLSRYYYELSRKIEASNEEAIQTIKNLSSYARKYHNKAMGMANRNTDFKDVYDISLMGQKIDSHFTKALHLKLKSNENGD